MPGPASIRYARPFRTTLTAGPLRSGSAFGVPVPSMTTEVCAPTGSNAITSASSTAPRPPFHMRRITSPA